MNFMNMLSQKFKMPQPESSLPGRIEPIPTAEIHAVNKRSLKEPYPEGMETILLGLGCFWGAERIFWKLDGVWVTAVGYAGGNTRNPTYQEVCTGRTGHAEVVRVVYDPNKISTEELLRVFWESHDPTQGMRQGNDIGTQYRSIVCCESEEQILVAAGISNNYKALLKKAGFGEITTEITGPQTFFFAEDYHQQYLHKNPSGYCGIGGTGVACSIEAQHANNTN